jgi:hypothetical protein
MGKRKGRASEVYRGLLCGKHIVRWYFRIFSKRKKICKVDGVTPFHREVK